jgi:hypothetical protein
VPRDDADALAGAIAAGGRFDLTYVPVGASRLGPLAGVAPASTEVVDNLSDPQTAGIPIPNRW